MKRHKSDSHTSKKIPPGGKLPSFTSVSDSTITSCAICKTEKHPLYACTRFKSLTHDRMVSLLKEHGICMNCLRPGHFVRQCKSQHRCRKCQRPHHTLLHIQTEGDEAATTPADPLPYVFVGVILAGRRVGPPNAPVALETEFGWVLTGRSMSSSSPVFQVATHHAPLLSGDELLCQFWETEESPRCDMVYTPEEQSIVRHFRDNHFRTDGGRFAVPLLRKPNAMPLGESRSQAVRRFFALERSLRLKGQFEEFNTAMQEYFDMNHAELVPVADLEKPPHNVFYLPMHAVRKESSTTTKIRPVFDASAKSSSGVSLNDTLMVGPTIHPPLFDVLIRFRMYRVALVVNVSQMYRAVELVGSDRDFHCFVWRNTPDEPLADYRMTRVTFGVSASSFVANMSVKQNAADLAQQYPQTAAAVILRR